MRLGSHCQLGKPALSSDRQSGITPSPALSPIMEEQLAKLDPLAVDLQGKMSVAICARITLTAPAPCCSACPFPASSEDRNTFYTRLLLQVVLPLHSANFIPMSNLLAE